MQDFSVGCLSIAAITAKMSEQLGARWIGSARLGSERHNPQRQNSMETNGRPALHRTGSTQTPSARIETVPEYWREQNVPKVRSVLKANTCFQAKGFMCFSAVTGF
jgi:hypothetical protein